MTTSPSDPGNGNGDEVVPEDAEAAVTAEPANREGTAEPEEGAISQVEAGPETEQPADTASEAEAVVEVTEPAPQAETAPEAESAETGEPERAAPGAEAAEGEAAEAAPEAEAAESDAAGAAPEAEGAEGQAEESSPDGEATAEEALEGEAEPEAEAADGDAAGGDAAEPAAATAEGEAAEGKAEEAAPEAEAPEEEGPEAEAADAEPEAAAEEEEAAAEEEEEEAAERLAAFATELTEALGASGWTADHDTVKVTVERDQWRAAVSAAAQRLPFFSWLSAVDWAREVAVGEPAAGVDDLDERYEVLCRLSSVTDASGAILVTAVPKDDPWMPSVVDLIPGAGWHEREAHEMFGLDFRGNPNLAHLYLPDSFEGHPLRKSYPLLSREVKPWPGTVDVEGMPGTENVEAGDAEAGDTDAEVTDAEDTEAEDTEAEADTGQDET